MVAPHRALRDTAGGTTRPLMFNPDQDLERTRRIDELCDQFERELQSGHHPRVEDYLVRALSDDREQLAVELLRVAIDYSGTQAKSDARLGRSKPSSAESTSNGQAPTVGDSTRQPVPGAAPELAGGSSIDDEPISSVGDFELLELLGSGGMGRVYRARQRSLERIVAIKLLRPDRWSGLSAQQRKLAVERFLRESEAAARLEHPHVLTVYDAGYEESHYYLAMRYVDGGSLADQVRDGPLPSHAAATYLEPVCRALHAVHQANIVHRDLKPSNILVDRHSNSPLVGDFGLAKVVDSDQELTLSGDFFGTPSYMSPEQVLHPGRVSVATDVYGVGATLYHLLTGRPPFQTPTVAATLQQILTHEPVAPRLLNPAIPLDLETITLKCLEKEPRRRYASALVVAQELQRFLGGQPILARPLRWDQKAWRWCTRHRTVAGLLASLAATLLVFLSVTTWLYSNERLARTTAEQATRQANHRLAEFYLQRAGLDDPLPNTSALPWLTEALRLEAGDQQREFATRVRLGRTLAATPKLERLLAHEAAISDAALSPCGRYLATADANGLVQIWTLAATADPPSHSRLGVAATCLQFSPTGDELAVGLVDGSVTLCRYGEHSGRSTLGKHAGQVISISFTSDGSRLASAGIDGLVLLFDVTEGKPLCAPVQHASPAYCVSFSPNDERLAVACDDGKAYIRSAQDGELLTVINDAGPLTTARWHPTRPLLLTGGPLHPAALHDLEAESSSPLPSEDKSRVVEASFSHRGDLALVAESAGSFEVFHPDSPDEGVGRVHGDQAIDAAALSPDGRWVVVARATPTVEIWETGPPPRIRAAMASPDRLRTVRFHADSQRFVVVANAYAGLWNLPVFDQSFSSEAPWASAAFIAGGKQLIVVEQDRRLVVHDVLPEGLRERNSCTFEFPIKFTCCIEGTDVWAAADEQGQIRFGRTTTSDTGSIDCRSLAPLNALAMAVDGTRVCAVGRNGKAQVISTESASPQEPLTFELGPGVRTLVFGPAGNTVLAMTRQGAALVDLERIESPPRRIETKGEWLNSARLGRSRNHVALGYSDGAVALLDLATGDQVHKPITTGLALESLELDATSDQVAVIAGADVRVWGLNDAAPHSPLLHHDSSVSGVTFCHGGRLLAAAADNSGLWVWDLETGSAVCHLVCDAPPLAGNFDEHQAMFRVACADGSVRQFELPHDVRSLPELKRLSERITGFRVDGTGSLVRLSGATRSGLSATESN